MPDLVSIRTATDNVVAAALIGSDWKEPLTRLAHAAGARDAVLMRNTPSRMTCAVVTDEAAETVAAFARGNAPPNSRYEKVRIGPRDGFRVDHDEAADARARGLLARRARFAASAERASWQTRALLGNAWDPSYADEARVALRDSILRRAVAAATPRGVTAIVAATALGCR